MYFGKPSIKQRILCLMLLLTLPGQVLLASNSNPVANTAQKTEQEGFWNQLSKHWLTAEQIRLLNMAHEIGMRDNGSRHANILQAILMQESHAGKIGRIGDTHSPLGKRSYGVMQIKLTTARDVLNRYPELGEFDTEEALLIRLVTDDYFNLQIASRHLLTLRKNTQRDAQAIMAYNTGLRKAVQHWYPEKYRYVKKIQRYLNKVITPFNKHYGNAHYKVAFRNES